MIFLAVYHRKRRKTSRGEVERRALICYTKADESEAIMKKIKCMAVVLAAGLLLAGCEEDETQNNKDAYRQIGINCMQEGDYEGAIDAFQNALDQSLAVVGEEEIDTCYYKAAAQYAAGKKEDAIETYQALINYDKKNAQAYFLLGELYRKENDMDKAKENFNLAAQYAGRDYEMYIALYHECYAAGMQTEGQEYLKKVLKQVVNQRRIIPREAEFIYCWEIMIMRKQSLPPPLIKRAQKLLYIWHSSMKRKAKMRRQPDYIKNILMKIRIIRQH